MRTRKTTHRTTMTPGSRAAQFFSRLASWWRAYSLRAMRDMSRAAIVNVECCCNVSRVCSVINALLKQLSTEHNGGRAMFRGTCRGRKRGSVLTRRACSKQLYQLRGQGVIERVPLRGRGSSVWLGWSSGELKLSRLFGSEEAGQRGNPQKRRDRGERGGLDG
jgi:hypothetical protein